MKCVICKYGETAPGKVTVTLEENGATIVIREVPARVCQTCGEEYVDEGKLPPGFYTLRKRQAKQGCKSMSAVTSLHKCYEQRMESFVRQRIPSREKRCAKSIKLNSLFLSHRHPS